MIGESAELDRKRNISPSILTPPSSDTTKTPPAYESIDVGARWWNVNLPEEKWTIECPSFLHGQSDKNIHILSTRDEDCPRLTWTEAKHLVDTNHINRFHRIPSDLRRYIQYCGDIKQRHGSILCFIQQERLAWTSLKATGDRPFTNQADYKILYNDWPYAIDKDIVHLIIWTKFVLDDDPSSGELTPGGKEIVEKFVTDTFCNNEFNGMVVSRENVAWFKNWKSLRSVHALEHIHVMLYKPPSTLVEHVTQGDRPMCEQF